MKISFSKILDYSYQFSSPFDAIVYNKDDSYAAFVFFFDNKISIKWKVCGHNEVCELGFEKNSKVEIDDINGCIEFTYAGVKHSVHIMVPMLGKYGVLP